MMGSPPENPGKTPNTLSTPKAPANPATIIILALETLVNQLEVLYINFIIVTSYLCAEFEMNPPQDKRAGQNGVKIRRRNRINSLFIGFIPGKSTTNPLMPQRPVAYSYQFIAQRVLKVKFDKKKSLYYAK
jgi:hypothetical protein